MTNERKHPYRAEKSEVPNVQKIALGQETRGIHRSIELTKIAIEFSEYAVAFINEMEAAGKLPYSLLPVYKEKILLLLKKTIHLHVSAFVKANKFQIENTIFDLDSSDEEIIENRKEYIVELLAMCLENYMSVNEYSHSNTTLEDSFALTTYYTPKQLEDFLSGNTISEKLIEEGDKPEDIKEFLKYYMPSHRLMTASTSIKSMYDSVKTIFNNFKNILSDENITQNLKKLGATDEEIKRFLNNYPPSRKIMTSIFNIKNPLNSVGIMYENIKSKLSDQNVIQILEKLGESEKEISEFIKNFTLSKRVQVAIRNIKDPETAVVKIFNGKINSSGYFWDKINSVWKEQR